MHRRARDHVAEWWPWRKRRIVAIILTLALAFFTAVSLSLIFIGPNVVAAHVARWFGLAPLVMWVWDVVRWPARIGCVVPGMDLVFYFAPNRTARWAWVMPGSVATALWILVSSAFKFYATNFGQFNATYGAIGGVIVVLLWLYVSGLAILIGAELNSVLARTGRLDARLE